MAETPSLSSFETPWIIAEVAQAHEGSVAIAHSFVDAAAEAGADAIKFQTHIADAESTRDEPFRVPFPGAQDTCRYDYWRRMEFTESQWQALASHARERGLTFLSSPFSVEAVELLSRVGIDAWKVGSGEVRSWDLLDATIQAEGPLLLSSGMSSWRELDESVAFCRSKGADLTVFQCTSRYPTPLESAGINLLDEMRERYQVPVGLSDHSGTVFPALLALARGAAAIELHVTFDRRLFGPDAVASVTFEELAHVVRARDAFRTLDAHPVDKDEQANELKTVRQGFGKSLALRVPQPRGTNVTWDMLTTKKPANGLPPHQIDRVVGRTLKNDVPANRLLRWEDFDG